MFIRRKPSFFFLLPHVPKPIHHLYTGYYLSITYFNSIEHSKTNTLLPQNILSPQNLCWFTWLQQRVFVWYISVLFPDTLRTKKPDVSLLDVEPFHYLVATVMSLPCLHADPAPGWNALPAGGINDQHMLHLVLAAHLVQVRWTFSQLTYPHYT